MMTGMTDEYLVGMLFKRLLLLRNLHGGPDPALARLARGRAHRTSEST
jgi:hypothetical protein